MLLFLNKLTKKETQLNKVHSLGIIFRIALSVTVRRFTFRYSRVYLSGFESFLIDFLCYADDFAIDLTHHKQLFS